jgi:hypothetical protein
LILLVLALVATATLAQSVTRGAVSGVVQDAESGRSLPGATVTVVHQPTNTRYTTVTRQDGAFSIPNVAVGGPYTVTVEMEGYQEEQAENVYVQLGQAADLQFRARPATFTEEVTVVGETDAIINPSRTGAASNVGVERIEELPTIGRGLEDFARLNPMITRSAENESPNAISIAGRSGRYNNIQIDGSVNNDLFGLADQGTPGGQADTTPISLDAIQEIQLVIADFDVRQGGFSGGAVNAITRSGSNDFNGSVFYFTRDDGLVGDVDALGEFGTFDEEQYGFRLGGPISRDKIFFFVNGEISERTTPTGWSIDGSSGQAFANGALIDEAELFRNALIDRYGFDPGFLGEDTRATPSDKLFARFDFNLNPSHQLTLRHNYVDAENDVNFPGSFSFEFPSEAYTITNETNSTVGQLNSVISPNMFNEARLALQTIKDRRGPRNGIAFPWIEIEQVDPGGATGEFEAGTEPFSTRNSLDQDIFEITNDFTWIKGEHTLTFGTHNELFSFDNLFIQNAFGAYEFSTLDDFLQNRPARRFQNTVVPEGQPDSQFFDVDQIGIYVNDVWRASGKLTLTFGLRVDVPFFPDAPSFNEDVVDFFGFRTDEIPDGEQLWQPRFGFNWDLEGNGRQQLRGGTGIFAGRAPYVWISNNYARTGIEQQFITAFGSVPFNPDPFNQPANIGGASIGEFNLIDPDFEFPQLVRYNLGYDRQLPWWGLIGTVELVHSDSLEEIDYKDVNLVQTGTLPFDGRPVFSREVPGASGAYLITNTKKGEATNFSVKVERPVRNGLWGFVSYAYGDATVVNDGTSSRAVSNFQFNEAINPNDAPASPSDFEVEHRFNAAGSYQFNRDTQYSTTVSAFYNHQSGRPYTTIYGFQSGTPGGINQDFYFSNDLVYVPAGPDDVEVRNGTFADLDAYIENDDCLRQHRGSIAPRNCARSPWNHTLDLRIAQQLPIKVVNLQLTVDVENVMNMLDEDSGLVRFVEFGTTTPWGYAGINDQGQPIYTLNSIVTDPENNSRFLTHNIASRWRAKLGLRLTF